MNIDSMLRVAYYHIVLSSSRKPKGPEKSRNTTNLQLLMHIGKSILIIQLTQVALGTFTCVSVLGSFHSQPCF